MKTKAKFRMGDCVSVKGLKLRGVISLVTFDEGFKYKVQTAHNRVTWNEKSLKKIDCRKR